jgi:hypothetical protein
VGALKVFNLSRRILIEQKKMMSKLNLIVSYDGEVRLQGHAPQCTNLKHQLEAHYH